MIHQIEPESLESAPQRHDLHRLLSARIQQRLDESADNVHTGPIASMHEYISIAPEGRELLGIGVGEVALADG